MKRRRSGAFARLSSEEFSESARLRSSKTGTAPVARSLSQLSIFSSLLAFVLHALFDVNQIRQTFKKTLYKLRIERDAATGPDFIQSVAQRPCFLVRPFRSECIKYVANCNYSPPHWELRILTIPEDIPSHPIFHDESKLLRVPFLSAMNHVRTESRPPMLYAFS